MSTQTINLSAFSDAINSGEKFPISKMIQALNQLENSEHDKESKDEYYKFFTELTVKKA